MAIDWGQKLKSLLRKKHQYHVKMKQDDKFLTTVDMTCAGISVTMGFGVFLLLGDVAKHTAGPSVIISYLIAGVAFFLAALCYMELATRFPQAGSSYVYVYSCIGEVPAVVVSTALFTDYILVCVCSSKCLIEYITHLTNSTSLFINNPLYSGTSSSSIFSPNLDIQAGIVITLVVGVSLIHKKAVPLLINILIMTSFLIVIGILMVAFFNADTDNWTGGQGFFANGFKGILQGSARCYVTFITYDAIALNAKHTVRRSEVVSASYTNSFLISLLTTFGVSVSTTLLAPFAMADTNDHSALLTLFDIREVFGISYIVIVGAVCGLLSSVTICLCASARLLQSFSEDGLFCPLFSITINSIYPVFSILLSGLVSFFIAISFDLNFLLDIVGTGSLIASIGVVSSVIVLRYGTAERLSIEQYDVQNDMSRESSYYSILGENSKKYDKVQETTELLNDGGAIPKAPHQSHECGGHFYGSTDGRNRVFHKQVSHKNLAVEYVDNSYVSSVAPKLSPKRNSYSEIEDSPSVSTVSNEVRKSPTKTSSWQTLKLILYSVSIIVFTSGVIRVLPHLILVPVWYPYLSDSVACLIIGILICTLIALYKKPRHSLDPNVVQFKTPCIPLLPISVLWANTYFLTTLSVKAWISLSVVSVAGLLGYFMYGKRKSKERFTEGIEELNRRSMESSELADIQLVDENG